MTLREVAAMLRVNTSTVYRMLKRDKHAIPGAWQLRKNSDYRFNREQVETWFASLGSGSQVRTK